MNEHFIIQRYAQSNWPEILGQRPFVASGPSFKDWAIKGSLEKHREWRFRPQLWEIIRDCFPQPSVHRTYYQRDAVAEFLLLEGIVQILWVEDHLRRPETDECVSHVAAEIPHPAGALLVDGVRDFLCGISAPEHFRSYVADDGLVLVPTVFIR